MVTLSFLFWMFVILFGIIGAMRGWAKELLVSFSAILALALITLLETYIPFVSTLPEDSSTLFWIRTIHPESACFLWLPDRLHPAAGTQGTS